MSLADVAFNEWQQKTKIEKQKIIDAVNNALLPPPNNPISPNGDLSIERQKFLQLVAEAI